MTISEWLKDQCNKLKYGNCQTSACLRRGGWTTKDLTTDQKFDKATCHAYECYKLLEKHGEI